MQEFKGRNEGYNPNRSNQQNKRQNYNTSEMVRIKVPDFSSQNLLGSDVEELVENVVKDSGLTSTQIRNFYSEIKNIERLIDTNPDSWTTNYNRIKLVKAKAIYNKNRDNRSKKTFGPFAEFIGQSIDMITNDEAGKKSFKIFCQLFEAFVGYSTIYTSNQ